MTKHPFTAARGFTLVEMLVSVAIFSVVMTIALGALLSMSEGDRKVQTLKSVVNNLNFAVDSMSRALRTGTTYHCDITQGTPESVRDCTSTPASSVSFRNADGATVGYCLQGTVLRRAATTGLLPTSCANSEFIPVTSNEVQISTLSFFVTGAAQNGVQPKVSIIMSGTVRVSEGETSPFNLQTSVTQRFYDQ